MRPLLSMEKDSIYLTRMLAWRRNWRIVATARSTRVESVVTGVIIGAGWLGLHAGISAIVHNCLR